MTSPALLIREVRYVEPGRRIATGDVLVRNGRIVATGTVLPEDCRDAQRVEGRGRLLTPGLIDVHTHGIGRSLYEGGADGLRSAVAELGRFGVTTVLPTVIPFDRPETFALLHELTAALSSVTCVHVPGLHLEGPFMAVGGAACPTLPGNVELL
ncbi:MAG TPA: hypothetical protein PKX00_19815, partial [Opitutaceae bacterium]|nr:hypothetical protein [Opitutaceae bacterium]